MTRTTSCSNLKERVYKQIKQEIIEGNFKPSEHLLETSLAEKFKVSRTPIREAFSKLEQDGYLQWVPKKGFQVRELNHKDLLEIFYIRIILEKGAATLAAKRIKEEDISLMEHYCNYKDEALIYSYNKEFHLLVARASGNSHLVEMLDKAIDSVRRILMLDPYMNFKESVGMEEHYRVIEALKNRDPEQAGKEMENHLVATRRRIHESLI